MQPSPVDSHLQSTDSIYSIKLDIFEGPLDLLLHLIQKDEMDVRDIRIAEITERYLEWLNLMERLDLDVASEFLVMAATLPLSEITEYSAICNGSGFTTSQR